MVFVCVRCEPDHPMGSGYSPTLCTEHQTAPVCARRGYRDKMRKLPPVETDFGGLVFVHVCQRCGIVAVETQGARP